MKRERAVRGRHLKVNEEIARRLQDQIRRRELRSGDQLPSERQLAGFFGAPTSWGAIGGKRLRTAPGARSRRSITG